MRRFIIVFLLLVLLFVYTNTGAEEKLNYKVDVSYPVTDYKKLNSEINKKLNYYQKLFLNEIKDSDITIFNYYTLIINYNSYVYNDILSYVFFVEYFVGGAHPNHFIFTINYDKNNNSFITDIDNLSVLSDYSRKELIKDPRIVNTGMLLDGTRPIRDNFKNFVFTDKGYIFYFERYKIAPYSSGDISLLVPYSILKGTD